MVAEDNATDIGDLAMNLKVRCCSNVPGLYGVSEENCNSMRFVINRRRFKQHLQGIAPNNLSITVQNFAQERLWGKETHC